MLFRSRDRSRGGGTVRYDLRPLLAAIEVASPGPPPVLRIRVRLDPALGNGRPDEVLEALGEIVGAPCQAAEIVRERVLLAGRA